jgi:hypothetical protein
MAIQPPPEIIIQTVQRKPFAHQRERRPFVKTFQVEQGTFGTSRVEEEQHT